MRICSVIAFTFMCLTGCVKTPVPEKFTGPTAHLETTQTPRGSNGHDFFSLSKIDGQNFYREIARANLSDEVTSTIDIPARTTRFSIEGHTRYPAPIFALTGDVYDLSGDTTFTPTANETYIIKGKFEPNYSAIWIESAKTGEIVGTKVERTSASIGFLKKLVCDPNTCKN